MFRKFAPEFIAILKSRTDPLNIQRLLESVGVDRTGRYAALDVGCGIGRFFPALSEAASHVVGFDYSPELLAEATKTALALPNVSLVLGDVRKLVRVFPPNQFDLLVRAYTSIGYYSRSVERRILEQFAHVATPRARLLIDSFNAAWFERYKESTSRYPVETFDFEERYKWNSSRRKIDCCWRYLSGSTVRVEIPFYLDGYDIGRIDRLLKDSGWMREMLFADLNGSAPTETSEEMKRLVIVARKADQEPA